MAEQKPVVSKPMFVTLCVLAGLVVIGFGVLVYLWLAPKPARREVVQVAPPSAAPVSEIKVTPEQMEALAGQISAGDTSAMTKLSQIADGLYRGINYQQEQPRVMANLKVMRAAFDKLGNDAAAGNTKAMNALKSALKTRGHLSGFAPDALGTAAAAGNKEAMSILLDYKKNNILLSTTVFALRKAAEKNDPQAVKFMLVVLADPKSKGLWDAASRALKPASDAGNADAQAAIDKYEQSRQNQQ